MALNMTEEINSYQNDNMPPPPLPAPQVSTTPDIDPFTQNEIPKVVPKQVAKQEPTKLTARVNPISTWQHRTITLPPQIKVNSHTAAEAEQRQETAASAKKEVAPPRVQPVLAIVNPMPPTDEYEDFDLNDI
jgi:hypothetical protein